MKLPTQISKIVDPLIKQYGGTVKSIGQYQGQDAFYYAVDDLDADICYLYLWNGKTVDTLTGSLAGSIIDSLLKD
ncbi:MAG: hypothetical protein NC038_05570 [Paludibacter sp.]|nr:hypothetical protein [Bacteroidales bacterium]MCM1069841.1 hypothetical protein [Prevotella sp.]MCM1353966.1 hypothetical protein [Bacteroides sp.]MCM1443392.1 hypothetical protein [Muribaculum sp.]MCM1482095.1 hypothetical protein [Paludibacter sp.]